MVKWGATKIKIKMDKKGKMKVSPGVIISSIVLLIVVFGILETSIPAMNFALTNFSNANTTTTPGLADVPFMSFFSGSGLVVLMVMAGVLVSIVAYFGFSKSKK